MSFKGKVAIVTGASRGIGRAIALALAKEGASVVVTARATDDIPHRSLPGTIDDTARKVQALGARAAAIPADLTKDEEIERLARAAQEAFGRVDILVNNAVVSFPGPVLDLPFRRFDITMAVGFRAPALLSTRLLPGMIQRGQGWILNISGGPATPYPGGPGTFADPQATPMLPLHTAKAALDHFAWGLAAEVRPHKIAVNGLRVDLALPTEGYLLNFRGREVDRSRWEKPEVAAEAALWMLRQDPASFTGVNIQISELRERYGIPKRQPWVEGEEE